MTPPVILRRSLKTRITLSVLAIFLISIWVLAFFTSWIVREDMVRAMGEQQASTANLVGEAINQELSERLRALEAIAGVVREAELNDLAALQDFLERRPYLKDIFNAGAFITRTDGVVIADIPISANRLGRNVAQRDYMIAAVKEGRSSVGSPVIGQILGTPVISMAAPIRNGQGKVVGALVGITDLNKPNILDKIGGNRYGATGGYLIVNKQHRLIVTATDKRRIMETLPKPGAIPFIDRLVQGKEETGILINPIGEEVLASAKGIPLAGWYVVVSLPTAEAFAPIRAMNQRVFIVTLLLTLAAGFLTWWMLRRHFSPMLTAVQALDAMSKKEHPDQDLPVTSDDEIGELIGGFNHLLKTLHQREEALKKSEFRWKFAIEGSGDGLWDWNVEDGTVFFSKRWKEMLGFDEDEIGTSIDEWWKRIHPDDEVRVHAEVADLLSGTSGAYSCEHRVRCKDGTYKWIIDRGMVVERSESGRPLRAIGTHGDISQRIRAAEQIRKLSHAVEQSPNGIVVTNVDAKIEYVNDAFVEITGYSRAEAIGKNPRLLASGRTHPAVYVELWQTLGKGETWKGIFCNKKKDGSLFWEKTIISPIFNDSHSAITHYVAVKEDISAELRMKEELDAYQNNLERMVAEKTLALSEEKGFFQDLVNTQPFGVYRIRTQILTAANEWNAGKLPPYQFEMVSERLCEQLGMTQAEAEANPDLIIERIHPDDLANFAQASNAAATAFRAFGWEGRLIVDGAVTWMRIDASPRRLGNEVAWTGIVQNITARKLESSLVYRSVVEASPDAFIAINENDQIIEWSGQAERLFGYSFDEVQGKLLSQTILPASYASEHNHHLKDFVATGRGSFIGKRHRMTALKRDGGEMPIELRIMALQIDGHWRFTSFIRDISDDLSAELQLVQAQKLEAIGHLTSGMAHDFNNILGIIIGNLDLLTYDVPEGESREMLDAAMAAAQRGAEVTKSLLGVARRRNLSPHGINLNTLLLELEPLLKQTVGKRIRLSMEASAEHACATLDAGAFNNALLNILINARDAMPDGGDVMVYCYSMVIDQSNPLAATLGSGAYAVVGVDDSGSGMTPEVVQKAFDPFFTTKGRDKGTGLGLATVFGFTRQSGGTARIVSTPGNGTSVQMILPTTAGTNSLDEAPARALRHQLPSCTGRVLVVDDEAALLSITARWLRDLGCEVVTADAAQAALDTLNQGRFDLMVTDIIMPGEMNGLDLARHAASLYPKMQILLVSGYPEHLTEEDVRRWVLLEKPLSQFTLSEAVASALGRGITTES
jgi:PAS domain S-box-containing protein